jgi:hypothetical protein
VILKQDGEEIGLGSIGVQNLTGARAGWRWGIDTVVPMRELESEGEGRDKADCMRQFKAAWQAVCVRPSPVDRVHGDEAISAPEQILTIPQVGLLRCWASS